MAKVYKILDREINAKIVLKLIKPEIAIDKKTIEMDSSFGLAHFYMRILYNGKGIYKEAIQEFQKATELTGGLSWVLGYLGYAYAMLGQKNEAKKILYALHGVLQKVYKDRSVRGAAP